MMINLYEQVWPYLSSGGWLFGLLGYFVKSSLILLVALLVQPLLKKRPPAVRHLVMRSAFLGVVALTLLWPLLPSWQMNWPGFIANGWNTTVAVLQPEVTSLADSTVEATSVHWSVWALAVWLMGSLLVGLRYCSGLFSAGKLARDGSPVEDKDTLLAARRIANQMDVRRPVRMIINKRLTVPIVFGLFRPTILLPADAGQWTQEKRDLVLRHELAHVKRLDSLWLHLAAWSSILHWFNPLVWATRGKMVAEAEFACDDSVLEIGVVSSDYAQHLLDCAREAGRLDRSVRTGVALAYNTQLEGRIMSILTNRKRATLTTVRLTALVTAVMFALSLPLVGLSWQAQAGEKPTPKTPATEKEKQKQAEDAALPGPDEFIEVDTYPEMTYQETPVYPVKAKKAGIEGEVWIKSLVSIKGTVLKAQLAKTSGQKSMDKSALKAAYQSKYKPAMQKGKPVAVWVTYKVAFALSDKSDSDK
ncbi:MAG: M56 family metallopeptidase [candidate division Zixibacteria bacterium]|nr:M56 family metallopeptidase [candidate division Zixibacteria bacterium]MDH3937557.1 M56 family metallopeptidase [candidate division Zixibacteria bacterium]MDH4034987.1 M56 family metallopeptidase [candidate division Zixibacteria bacterium]